MNLATTRSIHRPDRLSFTTGDSTRSSRTSLYSRELSVCRQSRMDDLHRKTVRCWLNETVGLACSRHEHDAPARRACGSTLNVKYRGHMILFVNRPRIRPTRQYAPARHRRHSKQRSCRRRSLLRCHSWRHRLWHPLLHPSSLRRLRS